MIWRLDAEGLPRWRFDPEPRVHRLGFTTRRGGVSDPPFDTLNLGRSTDDLPENVEANRGRVLESLGLDAANVATAGQVHGAQVRRVEGPGLARECDALVTQAADLALAVSGADCLPILFTAGSAVAAAHCGWRGAVAEVDLRTLEAVCEAGGVGPEAAEVHLGPSIRGCCYRVGPEVAERFPDSALRRQDSAIYLNLPDVVRPRLIEAGVPPPAILEVPACTACEPFWYFSHRRDGSRTGRHWAMIARHPADRNAAASSTSGAGV